MKVIAGLLLTVVLTAALYVLLRQLDPARAPDNTRELPPIITIWADLIRSDDEESPHDAEAPPAAAPPP